MCLDSYFLNTESSQHDPNSLFFTYQREYVVYIYIYIYIYINLFKGPGVKFPSILQES
jgi:hypothetical protein